MLMHPLSKSSSCSTCQHAKPNDDNDDTQANFEERLAVLEDALSSQHINTQDKIDWNTVLAYLGASVGVVGLIVAIITLALAIIDRKKLKQCLGSSSLKNSMESIRLM